jgi:hypothetical protein
MILKNQKLKFSKTIAAPLVKYPPKELLDLVSLSV